MSYQFYTWLHLVGVFMVIMSLGGLAFSARVADPQTHPLKMKAVLFHGVGLLIVIVAGFGLLAKTGVGFPAWAIAKMVIWLCLGGILVLAKRKPSMAIPVWWIVFILAGLAGWLAIFKPF